jgi:hypothetical protein
LRSEENCVLGGGLLLAESKSPFGYWIGLIIGLATGAVFLLGRLGKYNYLTWRNRKGGLLSATEEISLWNECFPSTGRKYVDI